jgi:multimeric flavodoxin WrbA
MKKVLFLNGSPRKGSGNSEYLVGLLQEKIGKDNAYDEVYAADRMEAEAEHAQADAIVVVFPLYVDSLPHHLIRWLCSFEKILKETPHKTIPLYALANCGFYEGLQNATALEILKNFCDKCGLSWRGGVGIGTGEMLKAVKSAPEDMWIKKDISAALNGLILDIQKALNDGVPGMYGPVFTQHGFPRFAFKLAGESGWRQQLKANGLKPRDIKARPYK